jgi:hypothetical protein
MVSGSKRSDTGRRGGLHIGAALDGQGGIVQDALQVALPQPDGVVGQDDVLDGPAHAALGADHLDLGHLARPNLPAGQFQLRHRQLVLLLAHRQFRRGRVKVPVGAVHVGQHADRLQLGAGVGDLAVQLGHSDAGRVGLDAGAAQQRLRDAELQSALRILRPR